MVALNTTYAPLQTIWLLIEKSTIAAKAQCVLPDNIADLNVRFLAVRMTAKGTMRAIMSDF